MLRKYQVMDVGFEANETRKLEKIQRYNLTEEEIARTEKAPNEMNESFKK